MNTHLSLVLSFFLPLTLTAQASTPVESLHGHGVFYLDAATACPKVGIGTRSEHACLRIGLDDEHSSAEIDRAGHRIVLRNDGTYKKKQIVADVVLPGWADFSTGRAPVGVHFTVWKKGNKFITKTYSHVVTREKPTHVEIEEFQVVLSDGKTETVAVTTNQAKDAVVKSDVVARLAGFLTKVTNNLADAPAGASKEAPLGDITISVGLGPASKKALRVQFFRNGADSELRIAALSNLVPQETIKRDLFLYGIESASNVGEIKQRGLKSGETLSIAVHEGKGSVTFRGTTSDLPDAVNSQRDFLETAWLGMVLAHQAHIASSQPSAH